MSSGVSTFSYAQAAKSPAVKATPVESQQSTAVVSPKSLAVTDTPASMADISAETIGEPVQSTPASSSQTESAPSTVKDIEMPKESQSAVDAKTQQSEEKPAQAASEKGAGSTDAVLGENDVPSTSSPRSSDNTWEKVSQTSGAEGTGAETGKQDAEIQSKVDFAKLKEAPIPTVNPWAKRAEALTKTAGNQAVPSQQKSNPALKPGSSNFAGKTTAQMNGTAKPKPPVRASGPPPPSADAQAWPKPETAVVEGEKKKSIDTEELPIQDKEKTSKRTQWVRVEHTPNPVFNTPLPKRGGRIPRGGREGTTGRGHATAAGSRRTTSPGSQPYDSNHSSRNESASNERKSNASPRTVDSQANTTKPEHNGQHKANGHIAGNVENSSERQSFNAKASAFNGEPKPLNADATSFEGHQNFRQQKRHSMAFTDTTSTAGDDYRSSRYAPRDRERGEYRNERGRGGYRGGRGGHSSFESQQYPFTQPLPQEGFYDGRNQSFSEQRSPQYQNQGHQYGGPREHRHGRQNSRSMSIPSPHFNNRYNGFQPMSINTDFGGNGYYPVMAPGPMSAGPFGYTDPQETITGQLQFQLEYYFSTDNLLKDMFLRKNMDNQGWVLLSVISGFKRVRNLSSDILAIRAACLRSREIELQIGLDDRDRVRKMGDSLAYVLPKDQRVPEVQYEEPLQIREPLLPLFIQDEMPFPFVPYGRQQMSPMGFGPDFSHGFPTPFTPNAPMFVPEFVPNNTNGYRDEHNGSIMSPNVPDFTPGLGVSYHQQMQHQANGQHSPIKNEQTDATVAKFASLNLNKSEHAEVNGTAEQHLTNGVSEKADAAAPATEAQETAA